MKRRSTYLALLVCLNLLNGDQLVHATTDEPFLIIVHTNNSIEKTDRKFLSQAFLKKVIYWDNGKTILPADLASDSSTRREFSGTILSRPVSAIKNHWQQMIFSGRGVQPPEFKSDSEVIKYVESHENALGYVSGKAVLSVKTKSVPWK